MKKIFLTLMLFFIGITAFPKQGWSAPACAIYGTYQPNSRVWDQSIGDDRTSYWACDDSDYMACFSSLSSCTSGYKATGVNNDSTGVWYADTNCSSFSGAWCTACDSGFTRTVSEASAYTSSYGNCCLNNGTGICNVQTSHECHPNNCDSANMVHKNSGTSSASCTCGGVTCADNQYVNGTSCSNCSTGAATCTSATVHTSCSVNYYLKSSTCTKCPDNASCSGGTASFSCDSGYEKNSAGTGCTKITTVSSCPSYMSKSSDGCCCNI